MESVKEKERRKSDRPEMGSKGKRGESMREVERRKPKEIGGWMEWQEEELEEQDPWSVEKK